VVDEHGLRLDRLRALELLEYPEPDILRHGRRLAWPFRQAAGEPHVRREKRVLLPWTVAERRQHLLIGVEGTVWQLDGTPVGFDVVGVQEVDERREAAAGVGPSPVQLALLAVLDPGRHRIDPQRRTVLAATELGDRPRDGRG